MPTVDIDKPVADPISAKQLAVLASNCAEFGITCYPMGDANQGIVHIIGPEQGLTQPGMTIVCGDSHTSTHGAFGALAFGIGTSEVEHVLATQTLPQQRPASMAVTVHGELPAGVTAKDLVLAIIGQIGTGGGSGHIIEYRGPAVRDLSMEGRMTVCNMSIEAGARAGMIAPDDTTFAYLEGRDHAPRGREWEAALAEWRALPTDEGAVFDREVVVEAASLVPYVTWGTNPAQVARIDGAVPEPSSFADAHDREAAARALDYMGLSGGRPSTTSASTPCSSDRAPTDASRTCGPPPGCWTGARCIPGSVRWWSPVPTGSRPRRSRRVWTSCSLRPVSTGGNRDARCAWP